MRITCKWDTRWESVTRHDHGRCQSVTQNAHGRCQSVTQNAHGRCQSVTQHANGRFQSAAQYAPQKPMKIVYKAKFLLDPILVWDQHANLKAMFGTRDPLANGNITAFGRLRIVTFDDTGHTLLS